MKTSRKIYPLQSGEGGRAKNFNKDGEAANNPSEVSNGFVNYYISILTKLKEHLFPVLMKLLGKK